MNKIRTVLLGAGVLALTGAGAPAALAQPAAPAVRTAPAASCDYEGILSKTFFMAPFWREVPSGKLWYLKAHMSAKLVCGIKTADVSLSLQRRARAWNKTRTRFHTVWDTVDTHKEDLAGKHADFRFVLEVSHPCTGKTNWRLRFFGSPGTTENGDPIKSGVIYYRSEKGRYYDCTSGTHP